MLIFIVAISVIAFKPAFEQQHWLALLPPLVFTLLLGWGLPLWMLVATDYTVTEDALKVRCGPFRWTVRRADVEAITPNPQPPVQPCIVTGPA